MTMPSHPPSFLLALALLFCLLSSTTGAHEARPALLRDVGLEQRLDAQIPLALAFRDEAGTVVQLREYFGARPVILILDYYQCPRLCPLVLDALLASLRMLPLTVGKQFGVLIVSIDARDTPAVAAAKKAQYLERYGRPDTADGWHFLTGEPEAIQRLSTTVGFRYTYDAATDQFAHAAGIMIVTPQGKLARYFYGIAYAPRELRLGLVEAAANHIGSPIDQLLLFCYHYDPLTGKYGLAIMNVIRLAGLVTVMGLGIFMGVMFRRDRRQRARPAAADTQPLREQD
jgi:protein SCO1/2